MNAQTYLEPNQSLTIDPDGNLVFQDDMEIEDRARLAVLNEEFVTVALNNGQMLAGTLKEAEFDGYVVLATGMAGMTKLIPLSEIDEILPADPMVNQDVFYVKRVNGKGCPSIVRENKIA